MIPVGGPFGVVAPKAHTPATSETMLLAMYFVAAGILLVQLLHTAVMSM